MLKEQRQCCLITSFSSGLGRSTLYWGMIAAGSLSPVSSLYANTEFGGQNTFTLEYYDVRGDESKALYLEEGFQRFDDLSLYFSHWETPYSKWNGYLQASSNHSVYRRPEGGRLSSAALQFETGETAIPLRLEVGDFYAAQSRRTLQQSLKGVQLELQPLSNTTRQSVQLFWGRQAEDYDVLFDASKDAYYGASWLSEFGVLGAFSLTHVSFYDELSEDDDAESESLTEHVDSLSWSIDFEGLGFRHSLEAEWAYLSGENTENVSLNGFGQFVQLSAYGDNAHHYLLSYERNNREFAPQGASQTADRQNYQALWSRQLWKRMNLRLRTQGTRSNLSTENIETDRLYSVKLSGRPMKSDPTALSVDVSFRERGDERDLIDTDNILASVSLSRPIQPDLRARLNYQFLDNDDQTQLGSTRRHQLNIGLDWAENIWGWSALVSPSVVLMNLEVPGRQDQSQLNGGIQLSAERDNHRLSLSHQHNYFLVENETGQDSQTLRSRFQWQIDQDDHRFDLNLDWYRSAEKDASYADGKADSFKASLAWTWRFDKKLAAPLLAESGFESLESFSGLGDLKIQRSYDESLSQSILDAGWSSSASIGQYDVYEGQLIEQLPTTQKLVLDKQSERLRSAAVLLPFSAQSSETLERELALVLDELIKRYGAPNRQKTQGSFDALWRSKLQSNELVRNYEWQLGEDVLRLGIPDPGARPAQMQLQLKQNHPSLERNAWGLDLGDL